MNEKDNIPAETLEAKEARAKALTDEANKERLERATKEYNEFVAEWSQRNGSKLYPYGDFAGDKIVHKVAIVLV